MYARWRRRPANKTEERKTKMQKQLTFPQRFPHFSCRLFFGSISRFTYPVCCSHFQDERKKEMQLKMMATLMIPAYLSYQSKPCRTDGRKSKEQEQMKTLSTHLNTHTPDLFCLSRRGLGSLQSRGTAGHRYQPPPLSKAKGHWFSPQETRRDFLQMNTVV